MSQYFSRLAERSGVATSAHALPTKSARSDETSGWSEQSNDVISQPSALQTDGNAKHTDPIGQSTGVYKENISISAMVSESHSSFNTAQPLPRSSSLTEENSMASGTVASSHVMKSDVSERNTIAAKPSKKIAIENPASAIHHESKSMITDDATIRSTSTMSAFDTPDTIKTHNTHFDTSSADRLEFDKTVPSFRENNKGQSTKRIASQPTQLVRQNEAVSHSSSRSSVQISIGKIELEIHAPAKSAVRTPQPVRTNATAAKTPVQNTAFNPHRHYLRGR
jgi:hypothetical protein